LGFKIKRTITSTLVIVMVVAFLGFGLNPDKSMAFELPVPAQLSVVENIENPDILCHIKITTDVVDEDGKIIASEQSAFFVGNPITTFSFTDVKTQESVAGFVVTPKIKCDTPDTRDLFDFGQVPVTVKAGELVVKVFSVAEDGKHLTETYNDKFTTKEVELTSNNEVSLLAVNKSFGTSTASTGSVSINADDIVGAMEKGKYDSYQHIVVEGDFNIFWSGHPSVIYRLTADTDKTHNSDGEIVKVESELITFREITVDKLTDSTDEPQECGTGEFEKGGVCVKVTNSNPSDNQLNNLSSSGSWDIIGTMIGFQICLASEDKSCLASSAFAPFYLIGIGIVALGLASRSQPRQQIYGLPQ